MEESGYVHDHTEKDPDEDEVRDRVGDRKARGGDCKDRFLPLRAFSQEETLAYDGIFVPVVVSIRRVLTVEHVRRRV